MPKFSIKELWLATTLIAFGVGLICWDTRSLYSGYNQQADWFSVLCWYVGLPLICAGIGALFGKHWTGAVIGLTLLITATIALFGLSILGRHYSE